MSAPLATVVGLCKEKDHCACFFSDSIAGEAGLFSIFPLLNYARPGHLVCTDEGLCGAW